MGAGFIHGSRDTPYPLDERGYFGASVHFEEEEGISGLLDELW